MDEPLEISHLRCIHPRYRLDVALSIVAIPFTNGLHKVIGPVEIVINDFNFEQQDIPFVAALKPYSMYGINLSEKDNKWYYTPSNYLILSQHDMPMHGQFLRLKYMSGPVDDVNEDFDVQFAWMQCQEEDLMGLPFDVTTDEDMLSSNLIDEKELGLTIELFQKSFE